LGGEGGRFKRGTYAISALRVILSAAGVAVFAHGKLKGTMSSGGGGTVGKNW